MVTVVVVVMAVAEGNPCFISKSQMLGKCVIEVRICCEMRMKLTEMNYIIPLG